MGVHLTLRAKSALIIHPTQIDRIVLCPCDLTSYRGLGLPELFFPGLQLQHLRFILCLPQFVLVIIFHLLDRLMCSVELLSQHIVLVYQDVCLLLCLLTFLLGLDFCDF